MFTVWLSLLMDLDGRNKFLNVRIAHIKAIRSKCFTVYFSTVTKVVVECQWLQQNLLFQQRYKNMFCTVVLVDTLKI